MKWAQLRAPQASGDVLIDPPASSWPQLAQENAAFFRHWSVCFCEESLSTWRRETQRLTSQLAACQLARWHLKPFCPEIGFLVTGHQPELFHPGVWAKNFAIAEAAPVMGLAPLNLISDHDQPKALAISVPVYNSHGLGITQVAFCDAHPVLAWEEYTIGAECKQRNGDAVTAVSRAFSLNDNPTVAVCSWERFVSFARRVETICGELLPDMILPRLWDLAIRWTNRSDEQLGLAELLAGVRRSWEARWGYSNAEVRLSTLCDTEPFYAFAAEILSQLPAFMELHNAELNQFRRENGLRSRTHPVPSLQSTGGWYEAPFWVWTTGQPRQRLWCRVESGCWVLRYGEHGPTATIRPVRRRTDIHAWQETLTALGWKIRPRALTLTLFVRLFLADMFVHGIGGGIYDRFTDRLIWRIWRIRPPHFGVVSATLRLPLTEPEPPPESRARLLHRLRDCRFNPERVLPVATLNTPAVRHLVARKQDLLRQWATANRQERIALHQQLAEIREALRPLAQDTETSLRKSFQDLVVYYRQKSLAQSREWSFVLHSDRALAGLVDRLHQAFARVHSGRLA